MRVSEVYASTQGEGPNVGATTVFLRFGGCNLRCPGWPCDTQHAIDPQYRKEWGQHSVDDLFERVCRTADLAGAEIITLTGGEPFLQPEKELEPLITRLRDAGYRIEAFTNGTLHYPDWAVETVSMIMDWKLPGSGEFETLANVRLANIERLNHSSIWHAVKFVCKDEVDFATAVSLWSLQPKYVQQALKWYYGRVWDGDITNAELVERVMKLKLPWLLNVQMHNYIWDANERGR